MDDNERRLCAKAHALGGELCEIHLHPAPNHWMWRYGGRPSFRQFKSAQEAFDMLIWHINESKGIEPDGE